MANRDSQVWIENTSKIKIDPATEQKQDDIIILLKALKSTEIGHGAKTIKKAGEHEALSLPVSCKKVIIQASPDNSGLIAVGGAGVLATATGGGVLLSKGMIIELEIDNLSKVFIDSTVNFDGVRYTWFS